MRKKIGKRKSSDPVTCPAQSRIIRLRKQVIEQFEISYAFFQNWHVLNRSRGLPPLPPRRTYYQMASPRGLGVTWITFHNIVSLLGQCYGFPAELTFAIAADNEAAIPLTFRGRPIVDDFQFSTISISYGSNTLPLGSEAEIMQLDALLKQSFEYCLSRFTTRREPDSNTSIRFFGAGFDTFSPITIPGAGILAIGTELDHLERVLAGEQHNPEKQMGQEQVADELLDLLRQTFILAIAYGFNEWKDVPWMGQLTRGLNAPPNPWPLHAWQDLNTHYRTLREIVPRKIKDQNNKLRTWINTELEQIGRFIAANRIPLLMLITDLLNRFGEDRKSSFSTAAHTNVPFPKAGIYTTLNLVFPDRPGTYRHIMQFLAEHGFDVWMSQSKVVVPAESATVTLLICLDRTSSRKGKEKLAAEKLLETELENKIEALRNRKAEKGSFRGDFLVTTVHQIDGVHHWDVSTQGEFFTKVSDALIRFNAVLVRPGI